LTTFLIVALNTRLNYLNNLSHRPDLPSFLKWTLALLGGALSTWGCTYNFSL